MRDVNEIVVKCMKAFNDCPFTNLDIEIGKRLCWSDEDFLIEAARKICKDIENQFLNAMYAWMNGKKLNITKEQAKEKNDYFKNVLSYLQLRNTFYIKDSVDWMAFVNDDPTIILNKGYPFDERFCAWAKNYKK